MTRRDQIGNTESDILFNKVFPVRYFFTCLDKASLSSDDLFWGSDLCTMFLHQELEQWSRLHLY